MCRYKAQLLVLSKHAWHAHVCLFVGKTQINQRFLKLAVVGESKTFVFGIQSIEVSLFVWDACDILSEHKKTLVSAMLVPTSMRKFQVQLQVHSLSIINKPLIAGCNSFSVFVQMQQLLHCIDSELFCYMRTILPHCFRTITFSWFSRR